jgi:hypothetical protein
MKKLAVARLRQALLLGGAAAIVVGTLFGLPAKRATAEPQRIGPHPMALPPRPQLQIIQPRFVAPSAVTLLRIADQALSDQALQAQIFRDPDAVVAKFHLSLAEALVLRHMDQTQFQVAHNDADRLVKIRLTSGGRMPAGATDARLITARMIVGRAILAAVGRSYLEAASANACCPWSKAIEVGVGGDPALYNAGFQRVE